MGCTSSAPNSPSPPQASATGETAKRPSAENENKMQNDEEIQVLPSCDSLHLDNHDILASGNDASKDVVPSPKKSETSFIEKTQMDENTEIKQDETKLEMEDKLSTLEEVVEKVVELHVAEKAENSDLSNEEPSVKSENDNDVDSPSEPIKEIEMVGEDKQNKMGEQKPDISASEEAENEEDINELNEPEVSSPSQSTSSRVTRWEALADIAAELPPSLTVDPLTGQIYTLSK